MRAHVQLNGWFLWTISTQRSLLNTQCKAVSVFVDVDVTLYICVNISFKKNKPRVNAAPIATEDNYIGEASR